MTESIVGWWPAGWGPGPEPLFVLACILVGGALAGELVARTTPLPRVFGYTAAGAVAAVVGLSPAMPLVGATRVLIDLALALLLFEIGSRVRLVWLRRNPGLLATSLAETALSALAVFTLLAVLGLPFDAAAACAVLSIPASAAVAGRVALELGADGQVTHRMGVLTALNTLYGVLALTLLKGWTQAAQSPELLATLVLVVLSFVGSLVLAGALGAAVAYAARRVDFANESSTLLVLGLVLLAIGAARWLGLSPLLVPLLAGLFLRNTTDRPWAWPRHFGTAGGVLVLTMFVLVGASWTPTALWAGGLTALAMLVARGLGKACAVIALAHWAKSSLRQGIALSVTLTPLSGTALVMLSELMTATPSLGQAVAPIVLAALAILELLGPLAVLAALRYAGELAPAANDARKEFP